MKLQFMQRSVIGVVIAQVPAAPAPLLLTAASHQNAATVAAIVPKPVALQPHTTAVPRWRTAVAAVHQALAAAAAVHQVLAAAVVAPPPLALTSVSVNAIAMVKRAAVH